MPEPGTTPDAVERLDAHNAGIDEGSAEGDRCGTVTLQSGRVCTLPARHLGPCVFTAKAELRSP